MGKRISKTVFGKNAQGTINHTTTTYYIHDASGNTMATYNVAIDAPTIALQEQSIYGSSRLGLLTLQGKQYELTDHLGNVRTVINENNTVASATDYYLFGMVAKSFSNGYRYGFNGKENDVETGTQDYGMRIYNPALAKFLSVDPIAGKFPMLTPYQFASNTPIIAIDLDGLEAFFIHGTNHGPWVWTSELVQPTSDELSRLTNIKTIDYGFNWKLKANKDGILEPVEMGKDGMSDEYGLNNQLNNEEDRTKAARLLADYVKKYREDNGIVDEEITLIGYSHGGNVAILASELLFNELGVPVNIITVNTPSMNSKKDNENPHNKSGINELIAFWTKADGVAGGISPGSSDYPETKGSNLVVKVFEINNRSVSKGKFWQNYLENVDPNEIKRAVNGGLRLRPIINIKDIYDKRDDTKEEKAAKDSQC